MKRFRFLLKSISCFQENYFIEDIASTNGSFVNGKRIRKCVLKNGDKLSFGPYKMMFQLNSSEYLPDNTVQETSDSDDTVVSMKETMIGSSAANH